MWFSHRRRERNTCGICWTAASPSDFQLSGSTNVGITSQSICCAYGRDGLFSEGFDCLIFPNAVRDGNLNLPGMEQCGRSKGLVNRGQISTEEPTAPNPTVTASSFHRTLCSKCFTIQPYINGDIQIIKYEYYHLRIYNNLLFF